MGLVRSTFAAIAHRDNAVVDSILAEAKAAGLRQLLLEATDHRGMCPLHAAAERSDSQMVTALLAAGASVDAAAEDGSTALVLAASAGDADSVRVLLSAGAAVDVLPKMPGAAAVTYEYGAVRAAVLRGSAKVLQQLLAAVQLPPSTAASVATMAIKPGQQHLLRQLFDAGANKGAALCSAAAACNRPGVDSAPVLKVMQDLLLAGVPVDSQYYISEHGMTPLMFAAACGSVQAVQMLLAAGADATARGTLGQTALHHYAAGTPDPPAHDSRGALVGLLIQAGVPTSLAELRNNLFWQAAAGTANPSGPCSAHGFHSHCTGAMQAPDS